MKKEDKKVMDQYATGEIKAVEPSEELPKYKFSKWEEYYTKAVDLIEKKFSVYTHHSNRQWCHDQLNRALDNTEFHHMDDEDVKCQMIDEILAGEFGINTQDPYLKKNNNSLNFVLNGLEYNAVQVALDHLLEHLEESLDDTQLSDDERSDLEEKRSATITAKSKFNINVSSHPNKLEDWFEKLI